MTRENNFDALRLLAAGAVIFSHAFLIAEGTESHEPLMQLSGGQSKLGLVGVFIFFAISGFLVTESFEKTAAPLRYLAKRALRIFPGLFAALLVSAFLIGAIVTRLPLGDYLRHDALYSYVVGNTLLNLTTHELPGVLFVDNPIGLEINGALWTLRYEFMMYLMVLVLGIARLLDWRVLLLLLALGLAYPHLPALAFLDAFGWLLPYFVMGMLLYKLRDRGIFDGRLALLAAAGLVISVPLRQFNELFAVFGGYLVLYVALDRRLPVLPATRFGDLSYGLYIYGWPIEVLVIYACGGRASWWQLFLTALPLAALTAFLSWRFVEEPILRLKPRAATMRRAAAIRLSASASPPPGLPRPGRPP
ncbi:MAG: acyltransferase family protein [Stellaceae bacterium]